MSLMLLQIPKTLIPKNQTDKLNTVPAKVTMSRVISVRTNIQTRLNIKAKITKGRSTFGTYFE